MNEGKYRVTCFAHNNIFYMIIYKFTKLFTILLWTIYIFIDIYRISKNNGNYLALFSCTLYIQQVYS